MDPIPVARAPVPEPIVSFDRLAVGRTIARSLLATPLKPQGGKGRVCTSAIVRVVDILLTEGFPRACVIANVLGMSVRTLQRHLAHAGTTYAAQVKRARFAAAASLLEETDAPVLSVALDLGYSDHAHFTRAFRRWSGNSPRKFRRLSRKARNGSPVRIHRRRRPENASG